MSQIFAYSLTAGIVLALLYFIYKLMMAGEKELIFNRYTLLGIYMAAFVAPVIFDTALPPEQPYMSSHIVPAQQSIMENAYAYNTDTEYNATGIGDTDHTPLSSIWPPILTAIYLTGVAVMIIWTLIMWVRLIAMVVLGEKVKYYRYRIVVTDNVRIAPFSWCGYIIMNRDDYRSADAMIIIHELSHLRHYHWIDLIVSQAVIVFNWFNPAAWLMREELKTVHEYQADMSVIDSGADIKQYQLLLIKKAVGSRFPSLTNSLNHSKLKKRITMMMTNRSEKRRRLRALALVPATAVALTVINNPTVAHAVKLIGNASLATLYGTADKVTNLSVEEELSLLYSSKKTDATDPIVSSARKDTRKNKQTVTGIVTNTTGDPMPGVIILINDKSAGVVTDTNGKFTIMTDDDDNFRILYPNHEVVSVSESTDNGNKTLIYVMDGTDKQESTNTTVTTITGNITIDVKDGNFPNGITEWYIEGKRVSVKEIKDLAPGQIKEIRLYDNDGKKKGYITLH